MKLYAKNSSATAAGLLKKKSTAAALPVHQLSKKLPMIKKEQGPNAEGKTHYWFTVCAKNGAVLVTSETYKTKRGRDKGVKSLLDNIWKFNRTYFVF
jgi:uncharacterized protein YegP (UPF0339 family)